MNPSSIVDDYDQIAKGHGVFLQHHIPDVMDDISHLHPSIEINYLQDCEMDYAFGERVVTIPPGRFCVFLAAQPHRVIGVRGVGKITNAYVSFEEFWSWPLPRNFFDAILAAGVAIASETLPGDDALAERFAVEISQNSVLVAVSRTLNGCYGLSPLTTEIQSPCVMWQVPRRFPTTTRTQFLKKSSAPQ